MEQVFFNVPLSKLEPIFKRWIREVQSEIKASQNQSLQTEEKLLTVKEAADFLNLQVPTIYTKVSKNELPYMKGSKHLYFSSTELIEYLKQRRKKTNNEIKKVSESYITKRK